MIVRHVHDAIATAGHLRASSLMLTSCPVPALMTSPSAAVTSAARHTNAQSSRKADARLRAVPFHEQRLASGRAAGISTPRRLRSSTLVRPYVLNGRHRDRQPVRMAVGQGELSAAILLAA